MNVLRSLLGQVHLPTPIPHPDQGRAPWPVWLLMTTEPAKAWLPHVLQIHEHLGKPLLLPIFTRVAFTRDVIIIAGNFWTPFPGTIFSVLTLSAFLTTLGGNIFSHFHVKAHTLRIPDYTVSKWQSWDLNPRCWLRNDDMVLCGHRVSGSQCAPKHWLPVPMLQCRAHIQKRQRRCGRVRDFPGGPVVKTSYSRWGARVQSLVGELRFHTLGAKNPNHKTETIL